MGHMVIAETLTVDFVVLKLFSKKSRADSNF